MSFLKTKNDPLQKAHHFLLSLRDVSTLPYQYRNPDHNNHNWNPDPRKDGFNIETGPRWAVTMSTCVGLGSEVTVSCGPPPMAPGWLPDAWPGRGPPWTQRPLLPPQTLAATAPALSYWCASVDLDVGLVGGGRGRAHAILDLCSHCHESLFHIRRVLSTRLQEGDAQLVCIFLKITHMRYIAYGRNNSHRKRAMCL